MVPATVTRDDDLAEPGALARCYASVRAVTERLCAPLAVEDQVLQAMPDVSPTRWHLAHVTWFFETFVLRRHARAYRPLDERYGVLFNSYYNAAGPQFARPQRGDLSRPTVAEVHAYRAHVDAAMGGLLAGREGPAAEPVGLLVRLGLHHEQQHQELILTDIKYNLAVNPLRPAYHARVPPAGTVAPLRFVDVEGGVAWIGHDGKGFAFDNEGPRHRVFLEPFRLGARPVTNAEYLEFVEAGGYRDWSPWLAEGWRVVQERGWQAPLYWERSEPGWAVQTLAGPRPLDLAAPVAHVSYFEADAYARWRGARLPTEAEWEHAAGAFPDAREGTFQDHGVFHPAPAPAGGEGPVQLLGDVWEWTASAYLPYPGFRPLGGDVGEYNGKFMVGQMVLRGGSCVTPRAHVRATYRNFFPPDARWQFSGIRLARDA
jgi:ergothioneine biosynthesis protein EgtB